MIFFVHKSILPVPRSCGLLPPSFNGKEKDSESGFHYYGARYYWSEVLTGWLSVDPMADKYPGISPYAYCVWNPVKLVDPDGEDVSTHTDEDGNVVAVYNDNDNGVYRHNGNREYTTRELQNNYSPSNTAAGGERMGETQYWDEFMSHDNKTGKPLNPQGRIRYGESWEGTMLTHNTLSVCIGLEMTALLSLPDNTFDIKKNRTLSPEGTHTGRLLKGKYATAESAGNYLAGMNGASGTTIMGFPITRGFFMTLAGILHSLQNGTSISGQYQGEIPYAGRRTSEGFQDIRNNSRPIWGRPMIYKLTF